MEIPPNPAEDVVPLIFMSPKIWSLPSHALVDRHLPLALPHLQQPARRVSRLFNTTIGNCSIDIDHIQAQAALNHRRQFRQALARRVSRLFHAPLVNYSSC